MLEEREERVGLERASWEEKEGEGGRAQACCEVREGGRGGSRRAGRRGRGWWACWEEREGIVGVM